MTDNDPYARLPEVPTSTLTSAGLTDGGRLASAQLSGMSGVPGGQVASSGAGWTGRRASTFLGRHGRSGGERCARLSADLAVWARAAGPWELPPSLRDRADGLR